MTPTSWAWTLASLVSVVLCFNGISLLVRRFMAIRLRTVEIDLYPLRFTFYFVPMSFIKENFRVYFPCQEARIGRARVPDRTNLHSFNLLWLMWAVCGGFFITNFILCNYLKVLVKPVFEKPVDSSEDVVTRGLIPYMHPGTGVWKKVMSKMPDPYPVLAETMIISTSWPQFYNMSKYNTIEKESRIFY